MNGPIDTRYRFREMQLQGERIAIVDIETPDNAPEDVKEGLARRAIVNAGGTCPCGARMILPSRAARRRAARSTGMLSVTVKHENDCPALLRGWLLSDLGPWSE